MSMWDGLQIFWGIRPLPTFKIWDFTMDDTKSTLLQNKSTIFLSFERLMR